MIVPDFIEGKLPHGRGVFFVRQLYFWQWCEPEKRISAFLSFPYRFLRHPCNCMVSLALEKGDISNRTDRAKLYFYHAASTSFPSFKTIT